MRTYKRLLCSDANEIAEAALVLPLLFTLILGIMWVGRAYNVYAAMNHAAREGARAYAGYCCATCSGGPTCSGTSNGYSATNIAQLIVAPILNVSRVDTARVTSQNPPPGLTPCPPTASLACSQSSSAPRITVCQNVSVGLPTFSPPVCGSAVYFQYPFSFPLPFAPTSVSSITLTGQAVARSEN